MSTTAAEITIHDLSITSRQELASELHDAVRFEDSPAKSNRTGRDFGATAAIVHVSIATIHLLAVWLTRHVTRDQTDVNIQTTQADGSTKTITIRHTHAKSEGSAGVLKQLAALCKMDVDEDSPDQITDSE